ncbi:MAG: zinc-dependent metalloprotease [Candidatus Cryptobacteroides sp.]
MRLSRTCIVMALLQSVILAGAEGLCLGQSKMETGTEVSQALTEYEKLFSGKKCTTEKGLVTLHNVDGSLLVEIPLSLMGRDFLIGSTVSGITDNRIVSVGEKPRAPMQVTFLTEGKKLNLCKRRFDLVAEGEDFAESLRRNTLLGIVSQYDIKAYNPDSSAVVVDLTELFLGDFKELSPIPDQVPGSSLAITPNFKRGLSLLEGIKAFDDNVSIRSRLSYFVTMKDNSRRVSVLDNTPVSVEVTRSIMLLPDEKARPRYADPRIGVFFTKKSRFGGPQQGVGSEYYAQRWRLEPSDTAAYFAGDTVSPVKPVVFYIDNAFPDFWKPYVKKGVEAWNRAFERIGFKDAVQARYFPEDDPEFDPDNIKYSCVRYSPSEVANSMGPSWTDPRTGEILNASVYIYHNVIKLISSWLFVQTAQADESVRTVNIPEEILGEGIAYVVSHEVGHCLGLMHNMAGSSAIPVDSLRSPSFTQRYGTTYSIMDYARFNYVAGPGDKARGVRMMPPVIGEYDHYAIEWLYRPVRGASTPEDEAPVLRRFISGHSGNPVYRYGKQQAIAKIDPSSFEEDLGDDPVLSARYGIDNLKYIAANIDSWVAGEDPDYSFRMEMRKEMVSQYQRYVTRALYNIGGIYLNERFEGDRRPSYAIVPAEEQRNTVKFLLSEIDSLDWLDRMPAEGGWPLSSPLSVTMGTALFKTVVQRCGSLWYSAPLMAGDSYGQEEFMQDVADYVWSPTRQRQSLSDVRMEVQSQFIDYLLANSAVSPSGLPQVMPPQKRFVSEEEIQGFGQFAGMQGAVPATRHICFSHLKAALSVLKSSAKSGDDGTRAHYALMINKIEKALK